MKSQGLSPVAWKSATSSLLPPPSRRPRRQRRPRRLNAPSSPAFRAPSSKSRTPSTSGTPRRTLLAPLRRARGPRSPLQPPPLLRRPLPPLRQPRSRLRQHRRLHPPLRAPHLLPPSSPAPSPPIALVSRFPTGLTVTVRVRSAASVSCALSGTPEAPHFPPSEADSRFSRAGCNSGFTLSPNGAACIKNKGLRCALHFKSSYTSRAYLYRCLQHHHDHQTSYYDRHPSRRPFGHRLLPLLSLRHPHHSRHRFFAPAMVVPRVDRVCLPSESDLSSRSPSAIDFSADPRLSPSLPLPTFAPSNQHNRASPTPSILVPPNPNSSPISSG